MDEPKQFKVATGIKAGYLAEDAWDVATFVPRMAWNGTNTVVEGAGDVVEGAGNLVEDAYFGTTNAIAGVWNRIF